MTLCLCLCVCVWRGKRISEAPASDASRGMEVRGRKGRKRKKEVTEGRPAVHSTESESLSSFSSQGLYFCLFFNCFLDCHHHHYYPCLCFIFEEAIFGILKSLSLLLLLPFQSIYHSMLFSIPSIEDESVTTLSCSHYEAALFFGNSLFLATADARQSQQRQQWKDGNVLLMLIKGRKR